MKAYRRILQAAVVFTTVSTFGGARLPIVLDALAEAKPALFTGFLGSCGSLAGGALFEMGGITLPLGINVLGAAALATSIFFLLHETEGRELVERADLEPVNERR